ncbi:CDP-diacylglycerol--glycerol-3-phosphate 3-phosphatidyltransferase PgsA [Peptoclostridium acidaminophilum DSM 3953]|uniref:CDP-diacylglycerol--glycerol-3-phosphate 3-phosphatidyltransferase n=1 Tax=Peptoclostridium acidaminophilum DSM 3953 TaxID=1286171 RepID=W8T6U9_PEPAC|nr:CDP-diacylglycerol--glycerol-3-phosphate 3-phosphatidyltransferase [Peptoclostridium acidaminophilum]AHM56605.1 CDP-diacylglycerol--glycerol-3-phosphate 3-phosphatidyltransferase PgsA [Peptoclostridium acidaminophilum DSM 3953]
MNLANKLTIFRMALVPVFMLIMLADFKYSLYAAALIFALASFTDFLDGYIARKYNMITNFGKLMDPLADKVLVSAALITMVETGMLSSWIPVIIISREFTISIIRAIAASSGVVIAASKWGKLKTISQIAAILLMLLGVPGGIYVMWLAAILTVYSGYDYIRLNKSIIA